MAGLLIIAHAPLASSLKAVALHAFPDCAAAVEALDVSAGMEADEVEQRARALLEAAQWPQTLIFCDVFGATPCNAARRLADGAAVKLVCGVNVPMLWRSLCYANEPLDALVARAVAGATQGIMQVPVSSPETSAPEGHDQAQPQHHQ